MSRGKHFTRWLCLLVVVALLFANARPVSAGQTKLTVTIPSEVKVHLTIGDYGRIVVDGTIYEPGEAEFVVGRLADFSMKVLPFKGYGIKSILANGTEIKDQVKDQILTLEQVAVDTELVFSFERVIPHFDHQWGPPTWEWAEDYSSATATFICELDETHVETVEAEISVAAGTGEDEGYLIYTATVVGPDGETYTDVVRVPKSATQEILRVYGNTRYKTGLAIAEEYKKESGGGKFNAVILATGEGFADALAGSYLAYQKHAPILLTRAKDVNLVNGYIRENLAASGTIYVLGGEKAFPEEWLAGLDEFVQKRISGSTRYNTGVEILREAGVAAGEEVLICTGENFADSLSVASTGKPLFLVKESLNKTQKAMLAELVGKGCTFTILGGEKAVTPDMEALIRAEVGDALASQRIAGSTRYRTSAILAERYFPGAASIVLATGETYPDGLCGGPLGALRKAPIVLTKAGQEKAARDYASAHGIQAGVVLGGPKIITDDMARSILGLDESVEVTEMFYK